MIYRDDLSPEAAALAEVLDSVELTEERDGYGEEGWSVSTTQADSEWVVDEIIEKLSAKGFQITRATTELPPPGTGPTNSGSGGWPGAR